jgi:hypothetical protein
MAKKVTRIRIFKNAWFSRFAKRENISDAVLRDAITKIEKGTVDADLGGHVLKQRIARFHQGKSGGYRTIILFQQGDKAFFVYGFAKQERGNIRKDELATFKQAAKHVLDLSDEHINSLLDKEGLTEITT